MGHAVVVGMWYLKALFLMVVASPLLLSLVARRRCVAVMLIACVVVAMCVQSSVMSSGGVFRYELNLRCPLYFMIGMALRLHSWDGRVKMSIWASALVVMMLTTVVEWFFWGIFPQFLRSLFDFLLTISMAIVAWCIIPSAKWPCYITNNAFPMFVMHGMIIYLLQVPFKAFGLWRSIANNVGPIPLAICAICFAVLTAIVIKRAFPRFANVAFGGR